MVIVIAILALILVLVLLSKLITLAASLAMLLLVALLAGVIANQIVKYNNGLTFTFISGVLGAVVGVILQKILGGPTVPEIANVPLLWTIAGAVIVAFVAKLVDRSPRRSRT